MELLSKITDAASMLWQTLDTQEKLILAYVAVSVLMLAGSRGAEQRREQRIAERAAELVRHRYVDAVGREA